MDDRDTRSLRTPCAYLAHTLHCTHFAPIFRALGGRVFGPLLEHFWVNFGVLLGLIWTTFWITFLHAPERRRPENLPPFAPRLNERWGRGEGMKEKRAEDDKSRGEERGSAKIMVF